MIKNILIILILFITLFIIIGVSISSRSKTVDCVVSDFGEFSECSKQCGGGTQTRTKTIITPPSGGGRKCPPLSETQDCNTQPCVDCVVSDFGEFSECSKQCGGGTQTRTKTIITPPSVGGRQCPPLTETRDCNTQACIIGVDCIVSDFGEFSECSKQCGGGTQTRTRSIVSPPSGSGLACPPLTETRDCNTQACIVGVDCVVSDFGEFSECSKQCGGGTQTRTRSIVSPPSGGLDCPPLTETRDCNTQACIVGVDCVVSDFGEFSECSAPCGGGIQTRTRSIVSPPSGGGLDCPPLTETRDCNTQACDISYKFTTSSIIKADRSILDILENWSDYEIMGTILEDAQIKSIIIKSPTVRDQGFGDFKSTYGVFIERKDSTPDGLSQLISLIPETKLPHYPRPSSGQSSNYTTLYNKVNFVPPINVKTGDELWVYVIADSPGYISEINTCEVILQTFY